MDKVFITKFFRMYIGMHVFLYLFESRLGFQATDLWLIFPAAARISKPIANFSFSKGTILYFTLRLGIIVFARSLCLLFNLWGQRVQRPKQSI